MAHFPAAQKENNMKTSTRVRNVFRTDDLTVVAVELTNSYRQCTERGFNTFESISPTAIIVCTASECFAVDTLGNTIDLDQLRRDVPALETALKN